MAAMDLAAIDAQNKAAGVDATGLLATTAVFLGLTTLSLALRLYVRGVMLKAIARDDVLLIISYLFFVVFCGACLHMTATLRLHGLFDPILLLIKDIVIAEASYIICMVFVKFALAAFFLRIVYKSWHRYLIYISIGIYTAYAFVPLFINMFDCGLPKPINFLTHQHCLDWNIVGPLNYVAAATNAIADWTMTLIPVVVIMHLQVSAKNKTAAMVLVALGSTASIISVVRVPLINYLKYSPDPKFFGRISKLAWISVCEAGIAIIAISASAYRPLWAGVSPYNSSRKYASNTGAPSAGRSAVRNTNNNNNMNKSGRHKVTGLLSSIIDRAGENDMVEQNANATIVTGMVGNKEPLIIEKKEEIVIHSEQA